MKTVLIDLLEQDCASVVNNRLGPLAPLKNQCLLVTGGTGFVGTWIAQMVAFLNDHHKFNTRLVLLSRNADAFHAKAPHLAERGGVVLVKRDVRTLVELNPDVNWIIHAAATPDNRIHASDPLRVIDAIVNGTRSVLEAASRLPALKKVLYISSGLVTGAQPPYAETAPETQYAGVDCSHFTGAYVESKRMAETVCAAYRSQHRLPIVTARPFAFVGPYQLLDRPWAVNNFLRDSLAGGPIRIQGDGETVRSYLYPSDMAFWLLSILVQGKVGASYNVGSARGVELKQLAQIIAGHFPTPLPIVCNDAKHKDGGQTRFVPDIALAQKTLGLEVTVDLETAIQRTLVWNRHLW